MTSLVEALIRAAAWDAFYRTKWFGCGPADGALLAVIQGNT